MLNDFKNPGQQLLFMAVLLVALIVASFIGGFGTILFGGVLALLMALVIVVAGCGLISESIRMIRLGPDRYFKERHSRE